MQPVGGTGSLGHRPGPASEKLLLHPGSYPGLPPPGPTLALALTLALFWSKYLATSVCLLWLPCVRSPLSAKQQNYTSVNSRRVSEREHRGSRVPAWGFHPRGGVAPASNISLLWLTGTWCVCVCMSVCACKIHKSKPQSKGMFMSPTYILNNTRISE